MKLNRLQAYFAILFAIVLICLLYQSIWIFSRSTPAHIYAISKSKKTNQISWIGASYQVNYHEYNRQFLYDGFDISEHQFRVRYLIFAPGLVRTDNFTSNWGPLILFFILCTLVTSIVFIRKDIISENSVFILQKHKPFVRILNNVIEDYEQHEIEAQKPAMISEAVNLKHRAEENETLEAGVSASVYKYNPNAIATIVIYIFYFFWAIPFLFLGTPGLASILFFGSILIFVPIYVQNTKNSRFKMEIPNEGSLYFSTRGIIYKQKEFELKNIESAVVHLESFKGFTYRNRLSTGRTNTTNDGDNNKISFRYQGEVTDLSFILNTAFDYWTFNSLMSNWSLSGIPVYLTKVFEDDFILQEETHFRQNYGN